MDSILVLVHIWRRPSDDALDPGFRRAGRNYRLDIDKRSGNIQFISFCGSQSGLPVDTLMNVLLCDRWANC